MTPWRDRRAICRVTGFPRDLTLLACLGVTTDAIGRSATSRTAVIVAIAAAAKALREANEDDAHDLLAS